ncbi:hypothetical protein ACFY0N_00325 [Streptomyces vinaceus]|uniref:hypothetical protein n=1 Tax=Streptomyces vinaceus TaxID=1960 RepID=UPI0036B86E87
MATKQFTLNTVPHVADVGGTELEFLPECDGDHFLDVYEQLQAAYKGANLDPENLASISAERLREITGALRKFLSALMLPESQPVFAGMRLPDRILIDLMEWVLELYGRRPNGSSGDSAPPSRRAGTPGKAASRSRA